MRVYDWLDSRDDHVAKVVCIVQARTTSERFPMKIMAGLHGRPMLAHVLERAAAIQGVDQVVLAVPQRDVSIVSHLWPHVYGGSEKDVLSRYAGAAELYEADVIVRVTGDCPLLAVDIASVAVDMFGTDKRGYLPVCQPYEPVTDGWDIEIFGIYLLREAMATASKEMREHVTTWMRIGVDIEFPSFAVPPGDYTALKCSVDTLEDLKRVWKIMDCLEDKTDFSHTATWRAWEKSGRP